MERFALSLVIIGAINWLLVGLFQWDLVAAIFGGDVVRSSSPLSRLVYSLIGIAGFYAIKFFFGERVPAKTGSEK
ncbi:DUF378 domain-containing protein [Thermoflavimicrobium dichotomicum]|uniref:DUF378 domain-containing protein n=1 Tax=Thermoflavimicrobium dichotomicum TaxID=46223 RepID=A0A1I3NCJ7_9BACL|nr:DUF378 domain-containing protein [Thermoflavimicrobium dichotomicum]SFJ07004.1 hypothetical protein SAMN05421852_10489 [Thermoflavimicrobium dichotomicum]